MTTTELFLILGLVGMAGLTFWVLVESRRNRSPGADQGTVLLQQQIEGLRQQLTDAVGSMGRLVVESQKSVGERLEGANRTVQDVRQRLGQLEGATRQMIDVGKDISSLQDILRAPKIRGVMGELFLGDLLGQILPRDHYRLQHRFKTGDIVDAVISLGPSLVPVDAKFPLENFKRILEAGAENERGTARRMFLRDVKKHVDNVSTKYILPDEGTYDFALMYIPAENVYYETVIRENQTAEDNVAAYALEKRVIPVSPNCFYAYLQAIVLGFKGLTIEKCAKEVMDGLSRLQGDLGRFRKDFDVVGGHLLHAQAKYEDATRKLDRFTDQFGDRLRLTGGAAEEIES